MSDAECTRFLQWALPQLHMRWPGFRKVRKQVCKRINRRMKDLELADIDAYRSYVKLYPQEWDNLDAFCRITISRFYRDRDVFDLLRSNAATVGGKRGCQRCEPGVLVAPRGRRYTA